MQSHDDENPKVNTTKESEPLFKGGNDDIKDEVKIGQETYEIDGDRALLGKDELNECNELNMIISLNNLPSHDVDSQTDPFVVVNEFELETESFKRVYTTKVYDDTHDVDFDDEIIIDYKFEELQQYRFDIYDCDDKSDLNTLSKHDYIGSATFIIGDILNEKGSIQTKHIINNRENVKNDDGNRYSMITIDLDIYNKNISELAEKVIMMNISCKNLISMNRYGGSDPYLEIWRMDNYDDKGCKNIKVYKYEIYRNVILVPNI